MPLPTTRPNTVKPPLLLSRSVLSSTLKNHWLVALLGSPEIFAIAIVPRVLEMPGSLTTGGSVGTEFATPSVKV